MFYDNWPNSNVSILKYWAINTNNQLKKILRILQKCNLFAQIDSCTTIKSTLQQNPINIATIRKISFTSFEFFTSVCACCGSLYAFNKLQLGNCLRKKWYKMILITQYLCAIAYLIQYGHRTRMSI